MPSSKSKSPKAKGSSPLRGYLRSNLETNGFICLIFTLLMTAVVFMTGKNEWYNTGKEDVSLLDGSAVNLGRILLVLAFVFAAYQFRPFLIKIERDTLLSLPLKKSQLLGSGLITGFLTIWIGGLLSLIVFYPAMNLSSIASGYDYANCVTDGIINVILPMCVYYLLSMLLILKCRNFWSAALLTAVVGFCSFSVNTLLQSGSGTLSLGAPLTELVASRQPFYCDGAVYLPTRVIGVCLRALTPLGVSVISAELLGAAVNLALVLVLFLLFLRGGKTAYLGEMNRPFNIKPLLWTLPAAALLYGSVMLTATDKPYPVYIIAASAMALLMVWLALTAKSARTVLLRGLACALILLTPLSVPLTNRALSERMTDDIPSLSRVKAVYFNAVEPLSQQQWGSASQVRIADLYETRAQTRYRFTSEETIEKVLALHRAIVDKIGENGLMDREIEVGDLAIASSDRLNMAYDEYKNDYAEKLDVEMGYDVNPEPYRYLPISGTLRDDYEGEDNTYVASFYYELEGGYVFQRVYSPLPVEWISGYMQDIFRTKEYAEKEIASLPELAGGADGYGTTLTWYEGLATDYNAGQDVTLDNTAQLMDLCAAIITDEAGMTDDEILASDIRYTIQFDLGAILNQNTSYFYIRDSYTETCKLLESYIAKGGDAQ